ncbi:MAG TPA: acyl-CoA dehydrogenase family protein [Bryobacteraceae bacterium]|nr:acyl-CoA dehydrogenase family protein [Bryobacteraceae bacterium]
MSTAMTAGPLAGGEFLLRAVQPDEVFTPEDFTEEHRAIARTTEEFWAKEAVPRLEAIQHQEPGVAATLLRKSAELGLTSVVIPEEFGGMGLDLTSMMIVAEGIAKDGSYAAWHGAHTGIGTLPLLLFGTAEQKRRYLPKLASCEMIAAYCLSEAQAGSDAMAARTTAKLAPDGTHYILNGQKMWITNGGSADLYTVFAKVDEKLTAFLVERSFDGVKQGAEERKMGIKGSSTCAIYFDNVKVPANNVLGEIGRGHVIAFSILNLGRLKLGAFVTGGAKNILAQSIRYAKERVAFGKPIAEFGLIQHKLAEMAARLYAAESMSYRVDGLLNRASGGLDWNAPDAAARVLKAAEEYAIECSLVKVFASEMLDFVVDEGVQIHGGYGYHQDYLVERAYRDSRINRIFEGTNEINRLLATGMLLKRAQKKQLPLVEAVKKLQTELLEPLNRDSSTSPPEFLLVQQSKKLVLFLLGAAYQKFAANIEEQQEVLAGIADAMMSAFTLESSVLRWLKAKKHGVGDIAGAYCSLIANQALREMERAATEVIAACSEGDELRAGLAVLRKLTRRDTADVIGIRRQVAGRLSEAGRYIV